MRPSQTESTPPTATTEQAALETATVTPPLEGEMEEAGLANEHPDEEAADVMTGRKSIEQFCDR